MKNLSLYYSMQVSDQCSVVFDTGIRECRSFVKQFSQLLFNQVLWISAFSPVTVTDTGGTGRTTTFGTFVGASATQDEYGPLVGTSATAESISDNALFTKVVDGVSAGQLQFGAVTFAAPSTTATTTTFRVTRVFTNGSGGTVTVQEVGLASRSQVTDATTFNFLLIRDLSGAVAVGDGQQLTLNYDFTTTI